jgi:hypothetical protein
VGAGSHDKSLIAENFLTPLQLWGLDRLTQLENRQHPRVMAFDIVSAVEGDAAEVADVHIKAMNDNALLHAQFPNAESLAFLRTWLANDTIRHARDGKKGVLVAKDEGVASFVKWEVRGGKTTEADQTAHAEDWPACCRAEYLDPYADLTAKVRKEVMGDSSYYREFQILDMVAARACDRGARHWRT